MKAAIDIAKDVTRGERQRDYAHPLINMVRIAVRQSITHRFELRDLTAINPYKAALAMVDVKLARQEATGKQDNIIDAIGYTDIIDRMARKLIDMGYCHEYDEALAYFDGWSVGQLNDFLFELECKFRKDMTEPDNLEDTTYTESERQGYVMQGMGDIIKPGYAISLEERKQMEAEITQGRVMQAMGPGRTQE